MKKAWTFGYLMAQAANQASTGMSASAFVASRLDTQT